MEATKRGQPGAPQAQAKTAIAPQAVAPSIARPFLSDYQPWEVLWRGDAPLFPSEQAARWFLRSSRQKLADVEAVAVFRRQLLVHPGRVASVIERQALDEFRARAGVAR